VVLTPTTKYRRCLCVCYCRTSNRGDLLRTSAQSHIIIWSWRHRASFSSCRLSASVRRSDAPVYGRHVDERRRPAGLSGTQFWAAGSRLHGLVRPGPARRLRRRPGRGGRSGTAGRGDLVTRRAVDLPTGTTVSSSVTYAHSTETIKRVCFVYSQWRTQTDGGLCPGKILCKTI